MELIFIYVWLYFTTFFHEMGHFIVAKFWGFKPYRVIVGKGKKILTLNLCDSVIEFRTFPDGGITYTSNLSLEKLKYKLALMYIAGPLVNLCLGSLFLILYLKFNQNLLAKPILFAFMCTELFLFISNIIPRDGNLYGQILSSDGKQFINAFTKTEQQFITNLLRLDRYTNNQNSSEPLFNNDLKKLQIVYQAQAAFNQQNFEQVIHLLEPILNDVNLIVRDQLYLLDLLTSIVINYGEQKYIHKADEWSKQAMELSVDIITIQGTRGAILIELGRYSEGKEMLLPLTTAGNAAIDVAVSCCYIAKADYYLGNEFQVKNWLNQAEKIGAAPRILQRIQNEIDNFASIPKLH